MIQCIVHIVNSDFCEKTVWSSQHKHIHTIYIILLVICSFISTFALADNQSKTQDLEQEVIRYNKLILQDSKNAKYINALGFTYYKLNRIPDAISSFKKAIALDPGCTVAYNNMGAAYISVKEYVKAEEAFKIALKLDRNYVKAAYNLSVALFLQKKYHKALIAYKEAEKINSKYVKKRFSASKAMEKIEKEELSVSPFPMHSQ